MLAQHGSSEVGGRASADCRACVDGAASCGLEKMGRKRASSWRCHNCKLKKKKCMHNNQDGTPRTPPSPPPPTSEPSDPFALSATRARTSRNFLSNVKVPSGIEGRRKPCAGLARQTWSSRRRRRQKSDSSVPTLTVSTTAKGSGATSSCLRRARRSQRRRRPSWQSAF